MKLQEEMFQLIEGWKESKMTKTAFINGMNISLDKFNYWIHKYNGRNGKLTKNKYPAQKSVTNGDFREVVIEQSSRNINLSKIIELTTPSGIQITVFG